MYAAFEDAVVMIIGPSVDMEQIIINGKTVFIDWKMIGIIMRYRTIAY